MLTVKPDIGDILARTFDLSRDTINSTERIAVYRRESRILLVGSEYPGVAAEMLRFAEETFLCDTYVTLSIGTSLSNEIRIGDVVLPHTLLHAVDHVEKRETKHSQHIVVELDSAIFLANYTLQNDYDFSSFGLSIGGIAISSSVVCDWENLDRLRTLSEADVLDTSSYDFLREGDYRGLAEHMYVIIAVSSGIDESSHTQASMHEKALANGANIVRFIAESLEGNDFPHIIVTNE